MVSRHELTLQKILKKFCQIGLESRTATRTKHYAPDAGEGAVSLDGSVEVSVGFDMLYLLDFRRENGAGRQVSLKRRAWCPKRGVENWCEMQTST